MDRDFQRQVQSRRLHGRLIRYSDEDGLLIDREPKAEAKKAWLDALMVRLGLTLHPMKMRVL